MGQATLDLPDPLQHSPTDESVEPLPPAAQSSADDLLSQLAGDDIDRLLAEASAEQEIVQRKSATAPPPEAKSVEVPKVVEPAEQVDDSAGQSAADDSALDALFAELTAPQSETPAALPPAVHQQREVPAPQTEAQMEADLAALDKAIAESAPPLPEEPLPPPGEAAVHLTETGENNVEKVSGPEPIEAELDANEREALVAAIEADPASAPAEPANAIHVPDGAMECVPLPVRILEWVNYPLLLCSDELRESLGKIALLTMFNSIAVLVYVLLFRKHPHH